MASPSNFRRMISHAEHQRPVSSMMILSLPRKGERLKVLRSQRGERIQKFPRWLQPVLLLVRNIKEAILYWGARLFSSAVPDHEGLAIESAFAHGIDYVYQSDVAGDVAEFGTMTGTTAALLAVNIGRYDRKTRQNSWMNEDPRFKPKTLFLFDSFQGLPKSESPIDTESPHVLSGLWSEGRLLCLSEPELRKVCEAVLPSARVRTYAGWFKDTLARLPGDVRFGFLHIDSDLYQSAVDVLDFCFSKGVISKGAAIYFDDWNHNAASPDFGERRAWRDMVEKHAVVFSDWGDYASRGKRFLVHDYRR
jgi:macrocin-O-methyltransferase TylF-like protien